MDFEHLRTFLAVKAHASFTRAARALQLSQSTVSFQIKAVESSMGRQLLERNREGVRLTAAGEVAWKVHQRYSDGMVSDWVGVAGSRAPAPVTTILPAK